MSQNASEAKKRLASSRPKERSPNFPRINLEEALKRAKVLYEHESRSAAHRDVVLGHWGYTARSGAGLAALGAVRAFGLLDGKGTNLRLSDLALDILADERLVSPGRDKLIRTAAMLPTVHKELWEHYDGRLPSDENLKFHLLRSRGFTDAGAPDFIVQFRATLAFVERHSSGILSPNGDGITNENQINVAVGNFVQWTSQGVDQFSEPRKVTAVNDDGYAAVEGTATAIPVAELIVVDEPQRSVNPLSPFKKEPGMETATHPFDTGIATFQWPSEISADEFEDFKDWLKIIQRKVGRSVATTDLSNVTELGANEPK